MSTILWFKLCSWPWWNTGIHQYIRKFTVYCFFSFCHLQGWHTHKLRVHKSKPLGKYKKCPFFFASKSHIKRTFADCVVCLSFKRPMRISRRRILIPGSQLVSPVRTRSRYSTWLPQVKPHSTLSTQYDPLGLSNTNVQSKLIACSNIDLYFFFLQSKQSLLSLSQSVYITPGLPPSLWKVKGELPFLCGKAQFDLHDIRWAVVR